MVSLTRNQPDVDTLAKALEAAKTVQPHGVSFKAGPFQDMSVVLQSSINFDDRIPDTEQQRIVSDAIFAAGKAGPLSRKSLLEMLGRGERSYLDTSKHPFVLATTVSLVYGRHLVPENEGAASVRFSGSLPPRFDRKAVSKIAGWPVVSTPVAYATVRVTLPARSKFEAFERGMETLDFLRGLWNMTLSPETPSFLRIGRALPINPVQLGPCHTVHLSDGTPAGDVFWYPAVYEHRPSGEASRVWRKVRADTRRARRRLATVSYRRDLKEAVVRYARALDGVDFDGCFVKLWGVLELLSDTVGKTYDQTVRRTLFILKDGELDRVVLEHLRSYRNATIHQGASREQSELLTYQLKRYVEAFFRFHFTRGAEFSSLADAGEFLDMPRDAEVLRKRLRRSRQALSYRKR